MHASLSQPIIGIATPSFGYSGGMERYTLDLVTGLHRKGYRPIVFATRFDTQIPEYAWITPVTLSVKGLPGKIRDYVFDWKLKQARQAHAIDVLLGCRRVRCADIALCGGTHLGHLRASHKKPGFWDRKQIRLERQYYDNAQAVVAHSKLLYTELCQDYGLNANKVVLSYPPVDAARFSPVSVEERMALRQQLGFPDDRAVFLFPSSSHERKGYPLLEAFFKQTHLPVQLVVAGRPISANHPNLRYLGYRKDIENCYRAADYVILASKYEPFGLVGPEAVLCGTPAVLAHSMGATETLSPESHFPFDPNAPVSLAAAMQRAYEAWMAGPLRLAESHAHLNYPFLVDQHVDGLLTIIQDFRPATTSSAV